GAPTGKTSETVYSPGESAPAVKVADRKGLQYRFPADTSSENGKYAFFDLITRKNVSLDFVEEKEVSGTNTLHLRGKQDWVDLSTVRDGNDPTLGTVLTMPAGWWGIGGVDAKDDITLNRWAKVDVELWVDPKTGVIVDQSLHYNQQFRLPGQVAPNTPKPVRDFKLDVFDAQQRWVDETVRSQAEYAKTEQNKIAIAKSVVPIAGGVLGVIALALGVFALLQGRTATAGGSGSGGGRRSSGGDAKTLPIDDDAQTAAAPVDDEPVTEAFNAQPKPDESQTEAIDLRNRDQN
ncbi:DUF3068 domain-containing protein, partial [Tsukamurella strandjordii]|uniref:DUF3068 domain-containing protein n=2 Tax=Tsukamurella TaxID=2060 RepID=UPI0039EF1218